MNTRHPSALIILCHSDQECWSNAYPVCRLRPGHHDGTTLKFPEEVTQHRCARVCLTRVVSSVIWPHGVLGSGIAFSALTDVWQIQAAVRLLVDIFRAQPLVR